METTSGPRVRSIVWTVVPLVSALLAAAPLPQSAVFVEGGDPKLAIEQRTKWKRGEGYVEGAGKENDLLAGKAIGPGDFRIKARLRILKLTKSAAAFRLGDSYFGFEGAKGTTFLSGPMFGGLKFLGPSDKFLKGDAWLDFEVVREGEEIRFLINGRDVHRLKHNAGEIGLIGFHPWRATMQVSDFSAEAENMTDASLPKPRGYSTPRSSFRSSMTGR